MLFAKLKDKSKFINTKSVLGSFTCRLLAKRYVFRGIVLMDYSVILIKILPNEYANDFLDGKLCFNTDEFFTRIDAKDEVRFDHSENADESWQIKRLAIQDSSGEYISIGGIINPVICRYPEETKDKVNLLCMYAYNNLVDDIFDERNLSFGCTAIIITDISEFIKRIKLAAHLLNKEVDHAPIEYVNKETYHGEIGPFVKFNNFSYQNEFRFILTNGKGRREFLEIGNIRDITMVIPSSEIKKIPKSISVKNMTSHSS
jgi:hypothetical protein